MLVMKKSLFYAVLLIIVSFLFVQCKKDDNSSTPSGSTYSIVYQKSDTYAYYNARSLKSAILSDASLTYSLKPDQDSQTNYEIILGKSSRDEVKDVASLISGNGYAIKKVGKKLVIYGTDDNYLALALYVFDKNVLKNSQLTGKGFLYLDKVEDVVVSNQNIKFNLNYVVKNNLDVMTSLTYICNCPADGSYYVGQGSCTDGDNVYFVIRNNTDNGSIVYKYSGSSFQQLAKTDVFDGGHSNDMTYDSKNGRVICISGGTSAALKYTVSYIDPSTMKVTTPVTISTGVTALTYNASKNQYAGRYGSSLYIMDENFNTIKTGTRTDGSSLTSQGMGSDDDYFYFPMSGSTNEILVYDWATVKYIRTFTISTSQESESMFKMKDDYYLNFYKSGKGSDLYRLDLTLFYNPS
jgi:hypothetical protein